MTLVLLVGVVSSQCFAISIRESTKAYDKGKRKYEREKYSEAIDYFQQAIKDCPENALIPVSMYFLGKTYEKMGNHDMAVSSYQKLIDRYNSGYWVKSARKNIKAIKAK